jgi:uncharacterized protein (DUF58 family)
MHNDEPAIVSLPESPDPSVEPRAVPYFAVEVTRAGWWWLGLTVLLMAIGVGKGINLLILLADSMAVVFFLNVLAARGQSRRVAPRRRLPDLVFARAPCHVEVDVTNGGKGKAGVQVEDVGLAHSLAWFMEWLPRGETLTLRGDVVLPRRGRYAWGPLRVGSAYPFGLCRRRRRAGGDAETIVLPALGSLHRGRFQRWLRGGEARAEEVRRKPRRHPTAQAEFHGLRPFRAGDSPRLIHWRTSARLGELMTREYEDAPGHDLIVVLDTGPPSSANREWWPNSEDPRFEAAVSLAATVCWEWCRRRGDRLAVVVTGPEPLVLDDFAGPDHGARVLQALAVARPSAQTDLGALLSRLTTRPLAAASLVVIGTWASRLGEMIGQRLRRPAADVDATDLSGCDFYEPPR